MLVCIGSGTGPQNGVGLNANPSFDSNTCKLSSSDTSFTVKSEAIPAVTNTTACEDGWFTGYKNWCAKNSMDCVNNITQYYTLQWSQVERLVQGLFCNILSNMQSRKNICNLSKALPTFAYFKI
jgi:hypothetical protein